MKVKDVEALKDYISHDPREVFTKHQAWLFASEYNIDVPTFDAVPISELEDIKKNRYNQGFYDGYKKATEQANAVIDNIKAEIKQWYWQADKQQLAEDPCVVDAMVDLFIRTVDKHINRKGQE